MSTFARDVLGLDSGPRNEAVNLMYELLDEGNQTRSRFHTTWDENARLMDGDHYSHETDRTPKIERLTLNRIYRAVTALAAVLTETRPRMVITPNEYGDEKIWYLVPQVSNRHVPLAMLDHTNLRRTLFGEPRQPRPSGCLDNHLHHVLGKGEYAETR